MGAREGKKDLVLQTSVICALIADAASDLRDVDKEAGNRCFGHPLMF